MSKILRLNTIIEQLKNMETGDKGADRAIQDVAVQALEYALERVSKLAEAEVSPE